jgi:hypothetical protein
MAGNGAGPATAAPSLRRFNIDGKNLEANDDDDDRILLYIIYIILILYIYKYKKYM